MACSKTYLMHKNIIVAEVKNTLFVKKIINITNKSHLPVGCYNDNPNIMEQLYAKWIANRIIPDNRQNLNNIISKLKLTPNELFIKSLGVSLTDCYWFKPEDSNLTWEDVNFYDNGFDETLADISLFDNFNIAVSSNTTNTHNPDITTNGALPKGWKVLNEEPLLIKQGGDYNILCANEIIASNIATLLKISHVPYYQIKINKQHLCCCPCIIKDNNTEMVSALQINHEYMGNGDSSPAFTYINNNFKDELKDLLLFHVLIHNTDGHELNISLLRNSDTLEYIGLAPAYDNGTSLGSCYIENGQIISEIQIKRTDTMKSFFKSQNEILNYIGKDIIKYKLPDITQLIKIIKNVYKEFNIPDNLTCNAIENLTNNYNHIKQKQIQFKKEHYYDCYER